MQESKSYKDIIETIEKSFLSLSSSFALVRYYTHNTSTVNDKLSNIEISKYRLSKKNQLFALENSNLERFLISSSLRGVFSGTYEGLNNNKTFSGKYKDILARDYDNFFSLVNLLRNLYSHELTWINHGSIVLKDSDFNGWVNYRKKKELPNKIEFNVNYSKLLPHLSCPKDYGFEIELNTDNLSSGTSIEQIIELYKQFMLSELSYNICITAKNNQ